jgi:hypothetical protein
MSSPLIARVLVVAAAAVFAFAFAAVIVPMLAVTPRGAGSPSASVPVVPGGTLVVGGVEYRAVTLEFKKEVQWGKTSGSIERAAGQWAIVRVDATNTSSQFQRVPWLRIAIRGVEGMYRLNDSLSRLMSRASGYGSIDDLLAPGALITTVLVFDVPTTRQLTLDIQDGALRLN